MLKRKLGDSEILVSEIGLGCMSLGTDETNAKRVIETALEEGITYFDTADLYDFGVNERIVGNALKKVREQVVIATKVGNRWNENGTNWNWDPSKSYIKDAVKQSLTRLGTDYIDLYQLHGGTINDNIDETIEAFEELKEEGYIRHYGISSIRPNVIREYAEKSSMISVMMQYSLLDRRPEETILPLTRNHGFSIVCRGSLAKGILTDKKWDAFSSSIQENGYLEYSSSELKDLLSSLKEKFSHRSLTEIATHYCLSSPTVASVVTGASTPNQIKMNVKAVNSLALTKEELDFLKQHTKSSGYQEHR